MADSVLVVTGGLDTSADDYACPPMYGYHTGPENKEKVVVGASPTVGMTSLMGLEHDVASVYGSGE